ncbi:MAG: LysM peptidoglycan-binding domain-containing protein [Prevotella sp.]|nr:LysM peptidoglycan-binding domain-containing protein [Prevotella sp.]
MKSNLKRCLMALAFVVVSALSFAQTKIITHVVASGETLETIAQRYNTTVETLTAINPDAAEAIYVGMEVKIPVTVVESVPETVTEETVVTEPENTVAPEAVSTSTEENLTRWDVAYRLAAGYLTKPSGLELQASIGAKYVPIKQVYVALMAGYMFSDQFKSNTYEADFVTIPLEIGGHFKLPNAHYISPYIGFDFNICVHASFNLDTKGMDSDTKKYLKDYYKELDKDLRGKLCADFRLGVKYSLNSNAALGVSMVIPMNDNQKGLVSSSVYPEICIDTCF